MIPDRRDWPRPLWKAILWPLLFPLAAGLWRLLLPSRVEGLARVPREGAFIVVSNHLSALDPPVLEFALRRAIRWMGKREIFERPLLGGFLRLIGCFQVNRDSVDRRAVLQALRVLEEGVPLGIFPEGHRSRTGALIRGRAGVGYFAARSGAPLLPVGVSGAHGTALGRFWRTQVRVTVGEPFRLDELPEASGGDQQAIADAIMRRIAALLPEGLRGEYA